LITAARNLSRYDADVTELRQRTVDGGFIVAIGGLLTRAASARSTHDPCNHGTPPHEAFMTVN
jgi:hypothetical protein